MGLLDKVDVIKRRDRIARVTPELRRNDTMLYRVEFDCGCKFWEYRLLDEVAPAVGDVVWCVDPRHR